jgi:hypothetical protein
VENVNELFFRFFNLKTTKQRRKMRTVREITAEEENFRIEPMEGMERIGFIKRDPVEPEPAGTLIIMAFRIIGYDKDCDGSLMARLAQIDMVDLEETGWDVNNIGLYPQSDLVVTNEELKELHLSASSSENVEGASHATS